VHERGRLASKRDQQKWFPVLRLIVRQTKVQRSAKVVSGFGARADGICESLLRRLGWRIEAPRRAGPEAPRRGHPADQIRKAPR
ncbi:hypothetical protein, partial [Mesorhizobium sp. M7A.F.Ca.CA.004.08.2.1]|uniref:hypothetical protein n=2 Tax=unclassified Mesorhizobium TaxID=325217 RepID=UPI0019D4E0CD